MKKKNNCTKFKNISLENMLNLSYGECVDHLKEKYGEVCVREAVNEKGYLVGTTSRTNVGLLTHTVCVELKDLGLEKDVPKRKYKVYCDALEQLLLHIKVIEEKLVSNKTDVYGLGLTSFMIAYAQINEYYFGKYEKKWQINVAEKIKYKYDQYIVLLEYAKNIIENSQLKERCYEPMLAYSWDGHLIPDIYAKLYKKDMVPLEQVKVPSGWMFK